MFAPSFVSNLGTWPWKPMEV